MRVSGPGNTGPVDSGEPAHEPSAEAAAAPAKSGDVRGSSGLADRAARAGGAGAAAPASDSKSSFVDDAKAQVEKALQDAGGTPKHESLSKVPESVRAAVEAYQKRDDSGSDNGNAFAWKTSVKGQTIHVAQESDQGAYMLTAFDKNGKKLAEGEVNSDEDLGVNW
jgi:hypothetical protein